MAFLLEGEGIQIRSAKPEDQLEVDELVRSTDCSLMVLGTHPDLLHVYHDRESLFPEKIEKKKLYRLIVEDEKQEMLGYVGFDLISARYLRAELSYFIADKYKGHGYATRALKLLTDYALGELGMRRVYLEIAEENLPSMRVAEKGGFVKEGLMRDFKLIGDKWHNYWLLAKIST